MTNQEERKMRQFQKIVDECQMGEVEGQPVDLSSANVVLQVYKALNESNKEKFLKEEPTAMCKIAWRVILRAKA